MKGVFYGICIYDRATTSHSGWLYHIQRYKTGQYHKSYPFLTRKGYVHQPGKLWPYDHVHWCGGSGHFPDRRRCSTETAFTWYGADRSRQNIMRNGNRRRHGLHRDHIGKQHRKGDYYEPKRENKRSIWTEESDRLWRRQHCQHGCCQQS